MPVENHKSLEDIYARLETMRLLMVANQAQTIDYFGVALSNLSSINTRMNTLNVNFLARMEIIQSYLNSTLTKTIEGNSTLVDILAAIEQLDLNSAGNAQTVQNILLDSIGACCDEIPDTTGTAEDQCRKSQAMADMVRFAFNELTGNGLGLQMPTVQRIKQAFTRIGVDGQLYELLTTAEAAEVLSAMNYVGVGGFPGLNTAANDPAVRDVIKEIAGTATSSNQASLDIRGHSPAVGSNPPIAVAAYFSAFQPGLVAKLWAIPAIFPTAGYEDDCEGPPPVEGSGYWIESGCTDSGIGPGNIVNTWEMSGPGDNTLTPNGFSAWGVGPMYCRVCSNTSTGSSDLVRLWTMSGSTKVTMIGEGGVGDVFDFTFPSENSWGIEMYAPGPNGPGDPEQCITLCFAWTVEDTDHCPE